MRFDSTGIAGFLYATWVVWTQEGWVGLVGCVVLLLCAVGIASIPWWIREDG